MWAPVFNSAYNFCAFPQFILSSVRFEKKSKKKNRERNDRPDIVIILPQWLLTKCNSQHKILVLLQTMGKFMISLECWFQPHRGDLLLRVLPRLPHLYRLLLFSCLHFLNFKIFNFFYYSKYADFISGRSSVASACSVVSLKQPPEIILVWFSISDYIAFVNSHSDHTADEQLYYIRTKTIYLISYIVSLL